MMINTIMVTFVTLLVWRWPWVAFPLLSGALLVVDFVYFARNIVKVGHGGWFPLAVAFPSLRGSRLGSRPQLVRKQLVAKSVPLER